MSRDDFKSATHEAAWDAEQPAVPERHDDLEAINLGVRDALRLPLKDMADAVKDGTREAVRSELEPRNPDSMFSDDGSLVAVFREVVEQAVRDMANQIAEEQNSVASFPRATKANCGRALGGGDLLPTQGKI